MGVHLGCASLWQTSGPSGTDGSCKVTDVSHTVKGDSDESQRSDKRYFVLLGCVGAMSLERRISWVASGTKRVAFLILLKVRMRSRLLTARRVRCSLTVQRCKQTSPPSLSSSQVSSVGQSPLDAFHINFIVRKRTLCPGICFCFVLFLISFLTGLLCSDCQVPGGWQCPQRHPQRDSDHVSILPTSISSRHLIWDSVKPVWVFKSLYLY